MMQMTEMADTHPGNLENEDGISIDYTGVAPAANVGRNISDDHIAHSEIVPCSAAIGVPTPQDMLNSRIGGVGVVGVVRSIHCDDARDEAGFSVTRIVCRNGHAARAFDEEGGMTDIGQADLPIGKRSGDCSGSDDLGGALRHGKTLIGFGTVRDEQQKRQNHPHAT
jgi:hypothetical protein